jgi:hypothetical protein
VLSHLHDDATKALVLHAKARTNKNANPARESMGNELLQVTKPSECCHCEKPSQSRSARFSYFCTKITENTESEFLTVISASFWDIWKNAENKFLNVTLA